MCKQFGKAVECFEGNESFWQLVYGYLLSFYHSIQYMTRCACDNVWFDVPNVICNPLCWLWRLSFSRTSIIQFKSSFAETSWFNCSLRAFPRPSNKRTNCPWKWLQLAVLRSFPLLQKKPLNHDLLNVLLSGRSSSLLSSAQIVSRWVQLSRVQKNVSEYACSLSWLPVLLSHCFFVLSHPASPSHSEQSSRASASSQKMVWKVQSVGRSLAQSNYPARK